MALHVYLITLCKILNAFSLVLYHFFSSRRMLEVTLAIYHRAASLSSQASSANYALDNIFLEC